jgi:hypothetical protein
MITSAADGDKKKASIQTSWLQGYVSPNRLEQVGVGSVKGLWHDCD